MKCQIKGCSNDGDVGFKGKWVCFTCKDLVLYYGKEDFACTYE